MNSLPEVCPVCGGMRGDHLQPCPVGISSRERAERDALAAQVAKMTESGVIAVEQQEKFAARIIELTELVQTEVARIKELEDMILAVSNKTPFSDWCDTLDRVGLEARRIESQRDEAKTHG